VAVDVLDIMATEGIIFKEKAAVLQQVDVLDHCACVLSCRYLFYFFSYAVAAVAVAIAAILA
jgi:hypothetical protein